MNVLIDILIDILAIRREQAMRIEEPISLLVHTLGAVAEIWAQLELLVHQTNQEVVWVG